MAVAAWGVKRSWNARCVLGHGIECRCREQCLFFKFIGIYRRERRYEGPHPPSYPLFVHVTSLSLHAACCQQIPWARVLRRAGFGITPRCRCMKAAMPGRMQRPARLPRARQLARAPEHPLSSYCSMEARDRARPSNTESCVLPCTCCTPVGMSRAFLARPILLASLQYSRCTTRGRASGALPKIWSKMDGQFCSSHVPTAPAAVPATKSS